MDLLGLLQFAVFIVILFLPSAILALLMRLSPIYRLSQRTSAGRSAMVVGSGLLCWGVTFIEVMWLASALFYSIAKFYFATTLGLVPGITRTTVAQYDLATVNEVFLRQVIPILFSQPCFNSNPTVCQLANMVERLGSLDSLLIFLVGVALVPAVINMWLSWRFTRPRPRAETMNKRGHR